MVIRLFLASMLTALAVLAAGAVRAQSPGSGPSEKPGAQKSGTPVKGVGSKIAAQPTTGEATPRTLTDAYPKSDQLSQAEVSEGVLKRRKEKSKLKWAAHKARLANIERWQMRKFEMDMLAMMRQSEIELERARLQAAQVEAIRRREAEDRMRLLEAALFNARTLEYREDSEYLLSRNDPEQYRRLVQARIEAYNEQQRAIQDLAQTATRLLQEQLGRQGQSTGLSGGMPRPASLPQGSTFRPPMPNPARVAPGSQPQPPPVQSLADTDRDHQRKMQGRYPLK